MQNGGLWASFLCQCAPNSPVLQSAGPHAVALASYTVVDKTIKNTVGFSRKDIEMAIISIMQVIVLK